MAFRQIATLPRLLSTSTSNPTTHLLRTSLPLLRTRAYATNPPPTSTPAPVASSPASPSTISPGLIDPINANVQANTFDAPATKPIVVGKANSKGGFRRFRTVFGRGTLLVVAGSVGTFLYFTQKDLYPGTQLDQEPGKKTVVVLGNGWGATSFLKGLDTEEYNVVVISPRNYFLFSPLLPSVTVGTLEARSIIQPTRFITRHKKRKVAVYEAKATDVDPIKKTVTFEDITEVSPSAQVTIPYDYLIYAVGADNQTFGIKGVKEYGCFLKELKDADKIRRKLLDCIETAAFVGQTPEEIDRLMHMVVVGGGPTGVEYAGELHDFLIDDLRKWYPEIADRLKITLIEALPNVLPAFSKNLIQYTESTFKDNKINVMTRTMVKDVKEKAVVVQDANKEIHEIPYGLLVWATGNTAREVTKGLMSKLPDVQTDRRGLLVDEWLRLKGAPSVFAVGDCCFGQYAPTAQVASQQGAYLARVFGKLAQKERLETQLSEMRSKRAEPQEIEHVVKKLNRAAENPSFNYSHQGSLAYLGSSVAIADLPLIGGGNFATGGAATFLFWRSAYLSTLYSARNRTLVLTDWIKLRLFGRDVSRE